MKQNQDALFLSALEQNQEKLYRICLIYSKDEEDAKDLFQEVLVQVWKSIKTFKGKSSIDTWMYRVTLNVCLRFRSKYTRIQNKFVRLDSIKINNFKAEEVNKKNEEKLNALRTCVKKLNEGNKAIIAFYLEGISYGEISSIIGLSENHIAVKVKRIKKKLFNCINQTL